MSGSVASCCRRSRRALQNGVWSSRLRSPSEEAKAAEGDLKSNFNQAHTVVMTDMCSIC